MRHEELIQQCEVVGEIVLRGDRVMTRAQDARLDPAVYLWVIGPEIVYLGSASRGLIARHVQHTNGFRNSARGRDHADYLRSRLTAGDAVAIMALWPPSLALWETSIPSHRAVEEWLLGNLDPKPVRNL